MERGKNTHRLLARIEIETKTPLKIGNGEKDFLSDSLVAIDVNGLPYIPGTSLSGILRHMFNEIDNGVDVDHLFGFQKKDNGLGSRIIFTEGKIVNSKNEVIDGLDLSANHDPLLKMIANDLPIRQHVRINARGVSDHGGKFDEQVVIAGTRFCFEIELVAPCSDTECFNSILCNICSRTFRVGAGTRRGFGEIEVVDLKTRILDLSQKYDLGLYLSKSSCLSSEWEGWNPQKVERKSESTWIEYKLEIRPDDFFLFGSGNGDDEVDFTPVKENIILWQDGVGMMVGKMVLIPASSVKGAISHRTAYHWNRLNRYFAGNNDAKVGKDNPAVKYLFGSEGEMGDNKKMQNRSRGNLIFSDVIASTPIADKILNHVSIDRFSGGAVSGALFSEKTSYGYGKTFTLTIFADRQSLSSPDTTICQAFEDALKDICNGMLPLGGGVNRGNGTFSGRLFKDNIELSIKNNEEE